MFGSREWFSCRRCSELLFKVRFWKKPPFSNYRYEEAINLIKKFGRINTENYAKRFKITDRTARLDLKYL